MAFMYINQTKNKKIIFSQNKLPSRSADKVMSSLWMLGEEEDGDDGWEETDFKSSNRKKDSHTREVLLFKNLTHQKRRTNEDIFNIEL